VNDGGVVIELHVPDFKPILHCYKELGFATVWEREPERGKGYLVLEGPGSNKNVLCFWAGNDHVYTQSYFKRFDRATPRGYAVEIAIMVDDVHGYYERVQKAAETIDELEVVTPLMMQPWGLYDFRVADPHGFYLRFTEPYDVRSDAHAVP
jgi:glyoxalase/bleomycin resistance protein/dioxygenase superfamily protein